MNFRSAVPAVALAFILAGCASNQPGDHSHSHGDLDLTKITTPNKLAAAEGASYVTDTGMKLPVDLLHFVLGNEVLNRTSDDTLSRYPKAFEVYAQFRGWDLDDEESMRQAMDQYVQAYTGQEAALRALEESSDPKMKATAAATRKQIEVIRKTLVNTDPNEHEHNVTTGAGAVPGEGKPHTHPDLKDPSQNGARGVTHSHGPEFGEHNHN